MKRVLVWVWIVVTGLVTIVTLVVAVWALTRRNWEAAILPGIIALAFGVSCFESARRRRFKFIFFES
jgi:hypothetical protein